MEVGKNALAVTWRNVSQLLSADLGSAVPSPGLRAHLEMLPPSEVLLEVACLTLMVALVLRFLLLRDPNSRKNLPPGPRPWPVLGNLPLLIDTMPLHVKLKDLARIHGPVYTIWIGSSPTVVVSGVDITREALLRNAGVFSTRPQKYSWQFFTGGRHNVVTSEDVPHYHKMRKIVSRRLLGPEILAKYADVRMSEVRKAVAALRNSKIASSSEGETTVEPGPIVRQAIRSILIRLCFGDEFHEQEHETDPTGRTLSTEISKSGIAKIEKMMEEFKTITGAVIGHLGDYIPSVRHLPATKAVYKRYQSLEDEIIAFLMPVIERRSLELAASPESSTSINFSSSKPCFMDILLLLEGDEKLSKWDVLWILVEALMGGTDTTGETVHWALVYLTAYPETQKRLYEEIENLVGHERAVMESDIENLPYLIAVTRETLRIANTVALGVPHATTQDCMLAGYNIPAKSEVIFLLKALSNDATIWNSPSEFRPERFLEPLENAQKEAYSPFGVGRRVCPGQHLGLLHVYLTLATLVQQFEWSPAEPGHPIDLSERLFFIAIPKSNLRASIKDRRRPASPLSTPN